MGIGFIPFLTGGLGWVLVSCSSELEGPGTEEEKVTPIAFYANQQQQEVTRASSPLETYTSSFKVWAYKNMSVDAGDYGSTQTVMDQYIVEWGSGTATTTTTNTNDWEYILPGHPEQTIKFWDWGAKAYRFFGSAERGVVPGTWTQETEEGTPVYKYTCNADATDADDAPFFSRMWFSTGDAGDYPTRQFGHPVTLEFVRPFAEVQFKFTFSDPDADPLPILEKPDFRPVTYLQRIAITGTVTITYPLEGTQTQESWSSAPDFSSKFLTSFTTPSTDTPTPTPYWYTVLPIRDQGAFILKVTVNGADKTCTVPAQYMNWQPGYRYTYIFKVNDEGGVELEIVNVAVRNWKTDDKTTSQYNLYNW